MNISILLQKPESKTLEFKQDVSFPIRILRTIIAFANTSGGAIIIGVEDKKHYVCGIASPHEVEEKLANLISDHIEPQILPEIEIIPWRNTYVLSVQIFPSSVKPHYFKNQGVEKSTYIRVGSSNRLADDIMISELRRVKSTDSFDHQPMTMLDSEDMDFRVASDLFVNQKSLTSKDLESLDLMVSYQNKKVPTMGAVILFGKSRLNYFPDAWIQVGRFMGVNKTHIIDTQEIKVYPVLAIDEVINFVKKHAQRTIEIKEIKHAEIWSVPLIAIRESIINAIVHADYAQKGSPIRVAIFDDRIEIENPGLLLFGLTIEEIKVGLSKLRNRVLGHVFFRLGLIERWGSGINRIIDHCVENGLNEPVFEEVGTHFRVTIFTKKIDKKLKSLNEIEENIVRNLQHAENGLSTKQLAELTKKSVRTIRSYLVELMKKEWVVEVASGINDPLRRYFYKNK
jgi:ATP-dependent DNA helicase RecG